MEKHESLYNHIPIEAKHFLSEKKKQQKNNNSFSGAHFKILWLIMT